MNATAHFTITETLHFVTNRKGGGNCTATLETMKAQAESKGSRFEYGPSRMFKDVVLIRIDGHAVALGFRSKIAAAEYYAELNA